MTELFENTTAGATFSECGKYRYCLYRIWDTSKPKVMIIGLNPSKANGTKNDNTITKVIKVARHNGFGGFYMMNLFAIVSEDPDILLTPAAQIPFHESIKLHPHQMPPSGKPLISNYDWLVHIANLSDRVVFAWGNFKQARERAKEVIELFPNSWCFVQNKSGSPKHPLYCYDDTIFIPFVKK